MSGCLFTEKEETEQFIDECKFIFEQSEPFLYSPFAFT